MSNDEYDAGWFDTDSWDDGSFTEVLAEVMSDVYADADQEELEDALAGVLESLRAGGYPETTRYNYLLAAAQLARYLGEYSPDADAAAADPGEVRRAHVEAFQAWMIETRSASTALNKHKGLQQFFKWLLVDEQAIERNPVDRGAPAEDADQADPGDAL